MSNLMEVIKSRRSTRAFKSELPPKDQIMQIVEAAEWAPSGMGKYLWHFTVIYNAEKSLKLARAVAEADNRGPEYNFYGAPVNAWPRLLLDQPAARDLRRTRGSCTAD